MSTLFRITALRKSTSWVCQTRGSKQVLGDFAQDVRAINKSVADIFFDIGFLTNAKDERINLRIFELTSDKRQRRLP